MAPTGSVYIISEGYVKLVRLHESGREILLGLAGEGASIGLGEALLGELALYTATALTTGAVYCLPSSKVRELARGGAPLAWRIQEHLILEGALLARRCEQFAGFSAEERLLSFMAEFQSVAKSAACDGGIELPFSFTELSVLVGVTPSYLCRLFNSLVSRGIVRRERGRLYSLAATVGQDARAGKTEVKKCLVTGSWQ